MEWTLSPAGRFAATALLPPLLLLACGGAGQASRPAATPKPGQSEQAAMPLPPWASSMKVAIQSPADGAKITANQVPLQVSFSGFQPSCDLAGTANVQGAGHYHVEIDKSLVDMFCAPSATISMQNVKSGTHTLTVLPALNDHAEVEQNAKSVSIDYEPTQPLAEIAPASVGTPSIKIVSPKAGSTLNGAFDVWVQASNFNVTCDLEGKPDVAGYGHWHVNLDSTSGPMMGMMTMLRMSCGNVLHLSAKGMTPGRHTLIAFLADNQHAPLNPMIEDKVAVNVAR
jgi:hypothetical protein